MHARVKHLVMLPYSTPIFVTPIQGGNGIHSVIGCEAVYAPREHAKTHTAIF